MLGKKKNINIVFNFIRCLFSKISYHYDVVRFVAFTKHLGRFIKDIESHVSKLMLLKSILERENLSSDPRYYRFYIDICTSIERLKFLLYKMRKLHNDFCLFAKHLGLDNFIKNKIVVDLRLIKFYFENIRIYHKYMLNRFVELTFVFYDLKNNLTTLFYNINYKNQKYYRYDKFYDIDENMADYVSTDEFFLDAFETTYNFAINFFNYTNQFSFQSLEQLNDNSLETDVDFDINDIILYDNVSGILKDSSVIPVIKSWDVVIFNKISDFISNIFFTDFSLLNLNQCDFLQLELVSKFNFTYFVGGGLIFCLVSGGVYYLIKPKVIYRYQQIKNYIYNFMGW